MQALTLDGATIETRGELHQQLAQALDFPAYYGRNLDALADCLGDIATETHIELTHPQQLQAQLGDYALRAIAVLEQAAEDNPQLHFVVAVADEPLPKEEEV